MTPHRVVFEVTATDREGIEREARRVLAQYLGVRDEVVLRVASVSFDVAATQTVLDAVVFFAYSGFEAVANLAEETKRPARDMPLGLLGTLGIRRDEDPGDAEGRGTITGWTATVDVQVDP